MGRSKQLMAAVATQTAKSKQTIEERRAYIEATLIKKRECERKALSIVEYLVDNQVVEVNWLLDQAKSINPTYYQDATEERAIAKICGYPLCSNFITKDIKQKYSINLKTKKVYDLTHRKNFCSNICFHASTYFKTQLLSTPLWLRNPDETHEFKVSSSQKSLPGDEVLSLSLAAPPDDEKEIEVNEVSEKGPIIPSSRKQESETKSNKIANPKPKPTDVVCRSFRQWVSQKTFDYLQNKSPQCQGKEQLDLVEEKLSNLQLEGSTPDQKRRPPTEAELKIRAFLSGKTEYEVEEEVKIKRSNQAADTQEKDLDEDNIVLPLADSVSQKALRRKILIDCVMNQKGLFRLLGEVNYNQKEFEENLSALVSTFNLTADTITFRPSESKLIFVFLFYMMSIKSENLKAKLDADVPPTFRLILDTHQLEVNFVHNFISELYQLCCAPVNLA